MNTDLHQNRLSHLTDQIGGEAQYPGSHPHGNLGEHEQHMLTRSTPCDTVHKSLFTSKPTGNNKNSSTHQKFTKNSLNVIMYSKYTVLPGKVS